MIIDMILVLLFCHMFIILYNILIYNYIITLSIERCFMMFQALHLHLLPWCNSLFGLCLFQRSQNSTETRYRFWLCSLTFRLFSVADWMYRLSFLSPINVSITIKLASSRFHPKSIQNHIFLGVSILYKWLNRKGNMWKCQAPRFFVETLPGRSPKNVAPDVTCSMPSDHEFQVDHGWKSRASDWNPKFIGLKQSFQEFGSLGRCVSPNSLKLILADGKNLAGSLMAVLMQKSCWDFWASSWCSHFDGRTRPGHGHDWHGSKWLTCEDIKKRCIKNMNQNYVLYMLTYSTLN